MTEANENNMTANIPRFNWMKKVALNSSVIKRRILFYLVLPGYHYYADTPRYCADEKTGCRFHQKSFWPKYTKPELLEKTDLPVVTLKLLDDEQQSCPFVRDDGCLIYADRPTTCRYYLLGVASLSYKEQQEDGFYIMVNEPHCKGFEEDQEWTVAEWRKDQGVDIHDEINAEWTELIVRKRSIPKNIRLTEKTKNMFFTASYDIDRFKRFVFESSFKPL
ncbi:MAG: hypothetical protein R2860_11535 [Desulfobacterales bacterium]